MIIALVTVTLALIAVLFRYHRREARLKALILPHNEIIDRYPDPEDERYAPCVRAMVRDMRSVYEALR